MADLDALYERLAAAVTLQNDDAAIRIRAEYEPQAGTGAKVFPPTYMESNGTRYHFERRWSPEGTPVEVVVLDSYQSQANRCEAALDRVADRLGLPRLLMRFTHDGVTIELSNLAAPHRSRDAYFLDSVVGGTPFLVTPMGKELDQASVDDLTPLLIHVPTDLVYGLWDSHLKNRDLALKLARSYTSEMIGWEPMRGKRAATKGDPLNLPGEDVVDRKAWRPFETETKKKKEQTGKEEKDKLNQLGHGMIPAAPNESIGGVAVRSISRLGVLSLIGLAQLRFRDEEINRAGRTALAALALAGDRLAFGGAGIHLRSGSDLVLRSESMEWVQRGARTEPLELTTDDALQLVDLARERLAAAGVQWSPEPVVLSPSGPLAEVIRNVLTARGLEDAEA
ncbi:type I-G CRISPR-associated RAMP protein Csb1/Cas7g [Tepidiforma thermophila]|nr:type I-U CRISPR-associated RAMP protein Csb1/Cas7u [Tepidiforma thermophila]